MGICTRLISRLLGATHQQPREAIEFANAAIALKGDVLILRTTKPMSREQRIAVNESIRVTEKNAGIKIILLEPGVEIAQLIKFHKDGFTLPLNWKFTPDHKCKCNSDCEPVQPEANKCGPDNVKANANN